MKNNLYINMVSFLEDNGTTVRTIAELNVASTREQSIGTLYTKFSDNKKNDIRAVEAIKVDKYDLLELLQKLEFTKEELSLIGDWK